MSNREDAEFSAATKVKIAAAVNHQCSAPLCKNPAHGTGDGSTINGGTACHIYSAAENGPRGRGGLTPKELADVDNGLWCCAYHGRIIDANQGASFPAVQLQMWKRLAEGRVRRAMSVEYAELGWIHEFNLEVETHAGQHWRVSRTLQKNNIISESSGVGKSLLLEALASISQGDHARRLCCFPAYTVQVQYETLTRESRAETSARAGGPIHRKIGGKECAIAPPDIAILYLNPNDNEHIGDRFGVKRLTRLLNVDESTLHALARAVTRDSGSEITVTFAQPDPDDKQDAPDESGAPRWVPMIAMKGQSNALPWSSLSSGERTKIALGKI